MANTKVTTNVIADDAITLDKMAGLARGKIIYGDSSGNPAALAVGSNGQVLKSDGTDISWGTDSSNDRDGAAVFNESGAAVDFRIEGDTATNLFFVDGSADKIGINTSSPQGVLHLVGPSSGQVELYLSDADEGTGASDSLLITKSGTSSYIYDRDASSSLRLGAADNNSILFIDGSNERVGIGTTSPGSKLTVTEAGDGNTPTMHIIDSADTEVAWFEGNRAGDTGAFISLWHKPSSAAGTNRAGIKFHAPDAGNNKTQYAQIMMEIDSNSEGSEDGQLGFHLIDDGSHNEIFTIKKDRLLYKGRSGSAFIRVDNRADGHDTGFEIYQNGSRKWELHSDDSNTDALSIRNNAGTEKFVFAQDGTFTAGNKAGKVAFRAYLGTSTSVSAGTHNFYGSSALTQEFDVGSCFNGSTGKFTAPQAGTYHFSATITMGADTAGVEYLSAEIVATPSGGSATRYVCGGWNSKPTTDNAYASSAGSVTIQLAASEEVTLGYETSDAITLQGGIGHCSFSGFLVA
jgi:hypothetical protein